MTNLTPPYDWDTLSETMASAFEDFGSYDCATYFCDKIIPLLKEGRLVEVPCKVGDPVYVIETLGASKVFRVRQGFCTGITLNERYSVRSVLGPYISYDIQDGLDDPSWVKEQVYYNEDEAKDALMRLVFGPPERNPERDDGEPDVY